VEPCETTWLNYSAHRLPAGGELPVHKPTSDECVAVCVTDRADCVAVQYSHTTNYCVIHTNKGALNFMTPSIGVDVYVVVRCNETGKRQVASLA